MSYLARISNRAAGPRANAPAVLPKGLDNRQTTPVARVEETGEEDETLSPTRPSSARPVRRQETDKAEEVARQEVEDEPVAEPDVAPKYTDPGAQRQTDEEGEEEVAPLRRQEDDGEEEIAALRRQEDEGVPEASLARNIARQEEIPLEDTGQPAPPPAQADLEPDSEPTDQELAGEREPSDLRALHRDISPGPGFLPPASAAQGETPENRAVNRPLAEASASSHLQAPHFTDGLEVPQTVRQNTGADESRPNVVIDQLDVLIHEPAVSSDRIPPSRDRERALRARYLRRL